MSVHHARKNMKDKNRFSVLLKHLTSMANLKNYALAKSLQYDESYISKWISGKLLPSDKNHELILQAISECIIQSLTPETIPVFLKEYQVRDITDLQAAVYEHLESEYNYVKELQTSTGSEVASKIFYYPELTLDQFIFKMKHPSLRKVDSVNCHAMVDILNIDTNYQMLIAEMNGLHNDRKLVLPGVHFSLMLDLEHTDLSNSKIAVFLIDLLSNLANIDFNLYYGTQAEKKLIFSVKDIYSISGMLMDQNHCLSVTTIEDETLSSELYHKLKSLCNKESLLIRKTSIEAMIRSHEYEHALFAQNPACLLAHFTEHFLPDDLHEELLETFEPVLDQADPNTLRHLHSLTKQLLSSAPIKILFYASVFNDFAISGEMDFYGCRVQLTPKQRLVLMNYIDRLYHNNHNFDVRVLPDGVLSDYQHIPRPSVIFADTFCSLRLKRNTPDYGICVTNKFFLNEIFSDFYYETWNSDSLIKADSLISHSILSLEILISEV